MRHMLPIAPQFYVTAPQECPYLPGRNERKLFTALGGDSARALNDKLSNQGFRRSQNVLYRPACSECSACMSARIRVADFKPSRSQRRLLNRNKHLHRETTSPWATEEQFELFRRYLDARHADGGMADMDVFEFAAMIEETPIQTRVIEYSRPANSTSGSGKRPRHQGRELVAVCLTDVLEDGVSLVYSFYDPDLIKSGLGTYMILDHIELARDVGLPYVYLGYWVPGSAKMAYKANFAPLEIYRQNRWQELGDPGASDTDPHPLSVLPITEQVAAISLPKLDKD